MKTTWRTLWVQNDIVVYRDEVEVDRLPGERIARVFLVYRGQGDTPGDIAQSVVELAGDEGYALFEPEHRLRRPRQLRAPVVLARAPVRVLGACGGRQCCRGGCASRRGAATRGARAFRRIAREEIAGCVQRWPADAPQTWEDRKRRRIERSRPFGFAHGAHA